MGGSSPWRGRSAGRVAANPGVQNTRRRVFRPKSWQFLSTAPVPCQESGAGGQGRRGRPQRASEMRRQAVGAACLCACCRSQNLARAGWPCRPRAGAVNPRLGRRGAGGAMLWTTSRRARAGPGRLEHRAGRTRLGSAPLRRGGQAGCARAGPPGGPAGRVPWGGSEPGRTISRRTRRPGACALVRQRGSHTMDPWLSRLVLAPRMPITASRGSRAYESVPHLRIELCQTDAAHCLAAALVSPDGEAAARLLALRVDGLAPARCRRSRTAGWLLVPTGRGRSGRRAPPGDGRAGATPARLWRARHRRPLTPAPVPATVSARGPARTARGAWDAGGRGAREWAR